MAIAHKTKDVSPIRLIGYFVGGILLANLVLMTSSAFRGHAAQPPAHPGNGLLKRTPAAAAEDMLQTSVAEDSARPDEDSPIDSEPEQKAEIPRPLAANICADAREKLVSGLTLYYLQRSRRPDASIDEVLESAGAITLLTGRTDPASVPTGVPCAG